MLIAKYKVGDFVRVKSGRTALSRTSVGRKGKILVVRTNLDEVYYILDIDEFEGGIWESEIELYEKSIKKFGLALFCEQNYK